MRKLPLALALAVCLISLTASAQKLTVAPGITITVPPTWKATQDTRTTFLVEHNSGGKIADASMSIHVEKRRNHEEAVHRLAEMEVEHEGEITYILIGGWPALERKATVAFQYPGELPGQERLERQQRPELKEPQGTDQARV